MIEQTTPKIKPVSGFSSAMIRLISEGFSPTLTVAVSEAIILGIDGKKCGIIRHKLEAGRMFYKVSSTDTGLSKRLRSLERGLQSSLPLYLEDFLFGLCNDGQFKIADTTANWIAILASDLEIAGQMAFQILGNEIRFRVEPFCTPKLQAVCIYHGIQISAAPEKMSSPAAHPTLSTRPHYTRTAGWPFASPE
jgi:hypothetical protein